MGYITKISIDRSSYSVLPDPMYIGEKIWLPSFLFVDEKAKIIYVLGKDIRDNTFICRSLSDNKFRKSLQYWYYTRYYAIKYSIINLWKTLSLRWNHKLIR